MATLHSGSKGNLGVGHSSAGALGHRGTRKPVIDEMPPRLPNNNNTILFMTILGQQCINNDIFRLHAPNNATTTIFLG